MKAVYVTPIKQKRVGLKRAKPTFLGLAVGGRQDSAFFSTEAVPLSSSDVEAMRIDDAEGERVRIPATDHNRVELWVPKGVGEIILASPGWATIKKLAATSGIEIPQHTPYEDMLSFVLPGESVTVDIGGEEHKINPAKFVAAGLRLASKVATEY